MHKKYQDIKKIHDDFGEDMAFLNKEIFKNVNLEGKDAEKIQLLNNYFETFIKKILDELINIKTNIYASIDYKLFILTNSLLINY